MANFGEDITNAENGGYLILIFAGIGLVVYVAYEIYELGGSLCTAFCQLFGGAAADCATSCGSGGGNTGNTYSSALNQTLTNPIGTVSTILGLNQGETATSADQQNLVDSGETSD